MRSLRHVVRPVVRTLVALGALASPCTAEIREDDKWLIEADMVYTAAGAPIENGAVAVADGKIVAVGKGGGGTKLRVAAVTPGLIELNPGIDTGAHSIEQSTETALDYSVADSLDLFSYRWQRELLNGVTSIMASPPDRNVLGGMCVVLKSGGERTLAARELAPRAGLRASLGTLPSNGNFPVRGGAPRNFYGRRPMTRMGVEWVLRRAYYDAFNAKRFGHEVDERVAARNATLLETVEDGLPLFLAATGTQDVHTAVFLKEEFGIQNLTLVAAAEAWKEVALVARSGTSVVLPPFPKDGRIQDPVVNDTYFLALDAAAKLQAAGVLVALSGGGSRSLEGRLSQQPGFAMRGGLSFEDALAAVTINPARMAGVDDRVGSIEVGKDADLVLWNGKPFEATSGIVGVLLNGKLVLDPRPTD